MKQRTFIFILSLMFAMGGVSFLSPSLSLAQDFHLQPLSPCIDVGAFLTMTRSAGSGRDLPVVDARGFWKDDQIQLENDVRRVTIESIDSETNMIHLADALTWTKGQGVSLPYFGEAPEIGAYEFDPSLATEIGFATYVRDPEHLVVAPGATAECWVSVRSFGGFQGKVNLSASGLPSGISATIIPNPVIVPSNGFTRARFRAQIPKTTPMGQHSITFNGTEAAK